MADGARNLKIAGALSELAKGMKAVSFYPASHPLLVQTVERIVAVLEELPLPESGLEIEVTRSALLFEGTPLPVTNRAVYDLNRELFLRRASKIIFLPELQAPELVAFLKILGRDLREIQDEGGIERVLLREKVSRIWANRVDYEGLTEMLKRETEEATEEELAPEEIKSAEVSLDADAGPPLEDVTIEVLLSLLERETDPTAYREHLTNLVRELLAEPQERRIEYTTRALSIFASQVDNPPSLGNEEIAKLAQVGIREMMTDELLALCIARLRDRAGREPLEIERILAAVGDRSVDPLLAALADEEDIIVRKAIVDIIVRIGRPAIRKILPHMDDDRWFIVRNVVTILGSLGFPDLAPTVAKAISHPDLRVKKEAVKALSRIPHPASVSALGELCFHPDETVALTATAALAMKREPEAVLALYQRAVRRKISFPHYRLAQEAIDSLRAIGTDEAITALANILAMKFLWETKKSRAMKIHALRSISRIHDDEARRVVENSLKAPEKYLRWEAERILKKLGQPAPI